MTRETAPAAGDIHPVVVAVTVPLPAPEAFDLFTARMDTWWPLAMHALNPDDATGVLFEPRAGGGVYETCRDGRTAKWADVLTYEPPSRVVLAWKPNTTPAPPTEVEIRFEPVAEGTTVTLEHRGWERLGSEAMGARSSYDIGWPRVLALYANAHSA